MERLLNAKANGGIPTTLIVLTTTITINPAVTLWFNPLTGILATLLFIGIGLYLRRKRIAKEKLVV